MSAGRIVGLDPGARRIGVAVSDGLGLTARGLAVAEGEEDLGRILRRIDAEDGIEVIVVGLPRNMDGSIGPKAREAMAFAERLRARTGRPVELWDERLTTVEATRRLAERGVRGRRRSGKVDQAAAQIILQSYLDARRAGTSSEAGGAECT